MRLALRVNPPLVIVRPELFAMRVTCSHAPCQWSCPVRDAEDAEDVLADHLTAEHEGHVLCAN